MSDEPTLLEEERTDSAERRRRSKERRGRKLGRPPRGRRVQRRRAQRRRAFLRSLGWITVLALVAAGIAFAVAYVDLGQSSEDQDPVPSGEETAAPVGDPQLAVALATFDEANAAAGASQIAILAYEPASGEGTVLLVPSGTVADIPGHGLLPIGRAYGFGQGPLLDATLDNLLGVDLDGAVGISRQGWSALLTRTGGFTVDVPERLDERLEDGSSRVRFQAGEQFLDGPRLAELLTFEEHGESELEQLPRVQLIFTGLLEVIAGNDEVLDPVFSDGAPMLEGSVPTDDVRRLLEGLSRAWAEDKLVVRTLPVSPINSGADESYRMDAARTEAMVAERLATSVPDGTSGAGRALQILNGNGTPGIGQKVAELLLPEGFRIVKTGNADRFDHRETRIIIYSDDADEIRAAERIQELLGVGRIERSRQPLSVADITVVVGLDFLEQREGET
ncbi:MAG: LCP family protein [Nitriliruptorales bacterium]|nr:LCP family protein [Nitriliruptorales bacterium]